MKEVRDVIKEVQYRRLLKRSFEPRKEFAEYSRAAFLGEVAKRRVAPLAPQIHWRSIGMRSFRYASVFAVVALLGTSGLVAFADNTNVGVDSPLYPLKRIGEQVRLVAAPAIREPKLRGELAHRRASELSEIETKKRPDADGSFERLRTLEAKEKELRMEFRKNIEKIQERSIEEDTSASSLPVAATAVGLCQVVEVVEKHGSNGKSEQYRKFEDRCRELLKADDHADDNETSISPTRDGRDKDDRKSEGEKKNDSHMQGDRKLDDRNGSRIDQE